MWAPISKAEIWARVRRTSGEAQDGRGRPWARWGETRREDDMTGMSCPPQRLCSSPFPAIFSPPHPHRNPSWAGAGQEVVAWAIISNHHRCQSRSPYLNPRAPRCFRIRTFGIFDRSAGAETTHLVTPCGAQGSPVVSHIASPTVQLGTVPRRGAGGTLKLRMRSITSFKSAPAAWVWIGVLLGQRNHEGETANR